MNSYTPFVHRLFSIIGCAILTASSLSAQDWQFVTGAMSGAAIGQNGTMLAVGHRGIIFRSTDNGSSWELPQSGTYQNLRDVAFISPTDVVAVGGNGTVLVSDDAGENWETVSTDINQLLFKVFFLNAQAGYALGADSLFGSDDGGRSWHPVADLPSRPESVWFLNETVGLLTTLSGRVYRTTDSGKSWTEVYTDTTQNLRSVGFLNNGRTGFICGPIGGLLKTSDSGQTWAFLGGADSGTVPVDVAVREDGVILLAGAGRNSERITLQRSENFGESWQTIPVETKFSGLVLSNICLNAQGQGLICSNLGSVLRTDDAWKTYVTVTEPTYEFPGFGTTVFKQPAFATEHVGIVPNSQFPGGYIRTTDGGRTWITQQYVGGELNSPTFFSESDGIIGRGSPGLIYRTTDMGESWNPAIAEVNPGGGVITDMQFFGPTHGLQIGDIKIQNRLGGDRSGIVYVTADSGKSWNGTTFDWPPTISDMAVLPNGTAWIAGGVVALETDSILQLYSYGRVFRTTNSGASWDTIYDRYGIGAYPSILGFRNESNGFIVVGGDDWGYPGLSVVLETTDGGDSWQVLRSFDYSNGEFAPSDIEFLNDSIWYAVGGNASIWRITDEGRTWEQETIDPLPLTFQNVAPALFNITLLPDDRTIMIFGRGAILRRSFPNAFSSVKEDENGHRIDLQLSVVPNPAQDEIRVAWSSAGAGANVRMYNMVGKEVLAESIVMGSSGSAVIQTAGISAGFYQVVLFDEQGRKVGSAQVVIVK